jgi:tetratricopeptide (TPR) repeat protein
MAAAIPSRPSELLQAGLAHQQAGRLAEAERCYRRVLAVAPTDAEALHLLGVIASQSGHYDRAVKLIGRAIRENRHNPAYYGNRGVALQHLKRLDEAVASYDRAIALDPGLAAAHYNRGNALRDLGRLDEAVASYQRAIALNPELAEMYSNLGHTLRHLHRLEEAIASYDQAIAHNPDLAEIHYNRGNALKDLHRLEEAVASYDRAIMLQPDMVEAYSNRGTALTELERVGEALESFDRALAVRPGYAEALTNRGVALERLARFDEAIEEYDRVLAVSPSYAEALFNRGAALVQLERFDEAVEEYDKALAIRPDHIQCRVNKAFLQLLIGRFAEGWQGYEWRRRTDRWVLRGLPGPEWSDGNPAGKRLLFYAEQGLGDTIQFSRFACVVADRAKEVFLEVQPGLASLLGTLRGVKVIPYGAPLPKYDVHLPLMSLPEILGVTAESTSVATPYLFAEPARVEAWTKRLPAGRLRVGIAWQGAPAAPAGEGRSVPLRDFAPLCEIPGVTLISLQKHHGLEQLGDLPPGMKVATLGEEFDSGPDAFLDAAAVIMSLDLVISSDTAIAHLAGALGCPLWVPLKHVPDWRWMIDREDTPWYSTARLFRQRRQGDWGEVFARIAAELTQVVAGERDRLVPQGPPIAATDGPGPTVTRGAAAASGSEIAGLVDGSRGLERDE